MKNNSLENIKDHSPKTYELIHVLADMTGMDDNQILQAVINTTLANLLSNPNMINDIIDNYQFTSVTSHISDKKIHQIKNVVINRQFMHDDADHVILPATADETIKAINHLSKEERSILLSNMDSIILPVAKHMSVLQWSMILNQFKPILISYFTCHYDVLVDVANAVVKNREKVAA